MATQVHHFNDALTPRELTVLDRIVAGQRDKEIARSLSISPRTVDAHRSSIRTKLGARNTADIVRIAMTMKAADSTQPLQNEVGR